MTADADESDPATLLSLAQTFKDTAFAQNSVRVEITDIVDMNQVNAIGFHRPKRPLNYLKCPLGVIGCDLADQENFVPNLGQDFADVFLGSGVSWGCVPVSHAQLQRLLHQLNRLTFRQACPNRTKTKP
jgi:hypothetical protein